jgi:predicted dehydrogenase
MDEVRVVLAGVHGHGQWHLRNLRRLQSERRARLVGICDLTPAPGELLHGFDNPVQSPSLAQVLAQTQPDIVVIATPIHTHAELTLLAARAGVHVLLEKPPAPTLEAYRRMVAGVRSSGVSCQVGFQSLGSRAVIRAEQLVRRGGRVAAGFDVLRPGPVGRAADARRGGRRRRRADESVRARPGDGPAGGRQR